MNENLSFNNVSNKHNKNKQIEPIPSEAPKRNRQFNELARENNEKYQDLRRDNKALANLNKMYNKTKKRNEELKQNLLNNPLFVEDYKRILTAYHQNVKIDPETLNILSLFDYDDI